MLGGASHATYQATNPDRADIRPTDLRRRGPVAFWLGHYVQLSVDRDRRGRRRGQDYGARQMPPVAADGSVLPRRYGDSALDRDAGSGCSCPDIPDGRGEGDDGSRSRRETPVHSCSQLFTTRHDVIDPLISNYSRAFTLFAQVDLGCWGQCWGVSGGDRMRESNRLDPLKVASLVKAKKVGRHADGDGLYLVADASGYFSMGVLRWRPRSRPGYRASA